MKKWKCQRCGYIHEGPKPPDFCPVCGAPRHMFVEWKPQEPPSREKVGFLRDLVDTLVVHSVAAHFPNGLLPSALLFLGLFLWRAEATLEATVFHLIALAALVAPVNLGSGIYDWQLKFGGARRPIFYKKIALAITLILLGALAISLRWAHPRLMFEGGMAKVLYLGAFFGMLGCAILLGHYGGKLAYHGKKMTPRF